MRTSYTIKILIFFIIIICEIMIYNPVLSGPIYYRKDLYPTPLVYDLATQSSESEPQEIESALCSISSEQIKTTATATITRQLKGVCHAREVRDQLRHIEMSLMKEIHHVLRQVQLLHKNQQRNRPVVFKYIK